MVKQSYVAFRRAPTHVEQAIIQRIPVVAEPFGETECLAYRGQHLVLVACVRQVDALHQAACRAGAHHQRLQVALWQVVDTCPSGIGKQGLVVVCGVHRWIRRKVS